MKVYKEYLSKKILSYQTVQFKYAKLYKKITFSKPRIICYLLAFYSFFLLLSQPIHI